MSTESKYLVLINKMEKNAAKYQKYENDCSEWINKFKIRMSKYIKCKEEDIEWYQFDEDDEDIKKEGVLELSINGRMLLMKDAYYLFMFIINSNMNIIRMHMSIKKKLNDHYFLKVASEEIDLGLSGNEGEEEIIDMFMDGSIELMETKFDNIIKCKQKRKQLGFLST
jgi:hypothetical protein